MSDETPAIRPNMLSTSSIPTSRSTGAVLAGIVLILAPLAALVVKFFSIGWMTFYILYASPLLAIGYILLVVIAIHGFLRARGVLRDGAGAVRARAAAWLTSIGVLLTGFFFVDGGDMDWGSTFMHWFGLASDSAAGDLSTVLSWVAAAAWLIGWVWLVVEWIAAIARRRRG